MSVFKVQVLGIEKISKKLDEKTRKQIPTAVAAGITRAAYETRDGLKRNIVTALDRPNPFTQNAFAVRRANRANMTAWVYVKRLQAAYLEYQVFGGTSYKKKVVPGRTYPLNNYGNLPRNTTRGAKVFRGKTRAGRTAYWRVRGGGRNRYAQMIGFIPLSRRYSPLFPFFLLGELHVKRNVPRKITRELHKVVSK